MAEREVSYSEILQILQLVESSSEFAEFHLKYGELEIDLRKASALAAGAAAAPAVTPAAAPAVAAAPAAPAAPAVAPAAPAAPAGAAAVQAAPGPAAAAAPAEAAIEEGMAVVRSPMVGTFYCAPEPGAQPFVREGQRVQADTVVCIIEVMKLMNSITAGQAGVVRRVLARDSQAVEFGEALMVIDPQG